MIAVARTIFSTDPFLLRLFFFRAIVFHLLSLPCDYIIHFKVYNVNTKLINK